MVDTVKQFKFKQTLDESKDNWEATLRQLDFKIFTPELTNFSAGKAYGYYQFIGPLAYFKIQLYNNPVWTNYAEIQLPIKYGDCFYVAEFPKCGPLIDVYTDQIINGECPSITEHPSGNSRIIIRSAGSAQIACVSGTFLRG